MRPARHDVTPAPRVERAIRVGFCLAANAAWLNVLVLVLALPPTRGLAANESWPGLFQKFQTPLARPPDTTPHPAVVKVLVAESQAQSSGSGSFVAARDRHGLVVTNWHVVRDAAGKIDVVFPDGFRSAATVLQTDSVWDLAALLIWRPQVTPLAVSHAAPQPGDTLTIAGYGSGDYRAVAGKCTQYVSPSTRHPYEIVELSAQARQGDSGGPILNDRRELAGVLFGASRGSTSGSYCGRVRAFLTSVWPDLDTPSSSPGVAMPLVGFDASPGQGDPLPAKLESFPRPEQTAGSHPVEIAVVPQQPPRAQFQQQRVDDPRIDEESVDESPSITHTPPPSPTPSRDDSPAWESFAGATRFEQAKTLLAVIGILTLWSHLARWIGR